MQNIFVFIVIAGFIALCLEAWPEQHGYTLAQIASVDALTEGCGENDYLCLLAVTYHPKHKKH